LRIEVYLAQLQRAGDDDAGQESAVAKVRVRLACCAGSLRRTANKPMSQSAGATMATCSQMRDTVPRGGESFDVPQANCPQRQSESPAEKNVSK